MVQARLWDWQLPQEAAGTAWPREDTQDATALSEATPQLGQPLHWPIVHEYVTQGGRLQLRVWLWQVPPQSNRLTEVVPALLVFAMHEATADSEATPQLGQPDHWPTEQE